jgi:hypothetical protein
VEGHRVHGVARTQKSAAGQVTDVVDTYRCHAELVGSRHYEQATTFGGDGEGGLTDLGEGSVTDNSVDTQRNGHANELLNICGRMRFRPNRSSWTLAKVRCTDLPLMVRADNLRGVWAWCG